MIKAIIFDLNGVFIQSPKLSDRFYDKFGVQPEIFMPALKVIMDAVRQPKAKNAFSYWKPYLEKWNVNLSEEEFFNFWFSAEKENLEMIELAKKLKEEGIKIFVLSNNFIERANYYKDNFLFLKEVINKVYYSWQTGFIKPDIRAYQNILNENNLAPRDCVYFDDKEENINIAESLGIKRFIFKNAEDTNNIVRHNN